MMCFNCLDIPSGIPKYIGPALGFPLKEAWIQCSVHVALVDVLGTIYFRGFLGQTWLHVRALEGGNLSLKRDCPKASAGTDGMRTIGIL